LAAKVGAASKAVVYQWESGKRKPSTGVLAADQADAAWRRLSNHCLMSERVHTLFTMEKPAAGLVLTMGE